MVRAVIADCFYGEHDDFRCGLDARDIGYVRALKPTRAVVATTDPTTLPALSTWYLVTNLPAPQPQPQETTHPVADLAEIVRLYGLRIWVEQSDKQVKQSLGWAQYQVRSDRAIRRHWQLVCSAFSVCWWAGRSMRRAARSDGKCR